MNARDRWLVGVLAAGVWAVVAITLFAPKPLLAINIDAKDVLGLDSFVKDSVERSCQVSASGTRIRCRG